jgi:hypothetical protein
MQNQLLLREAWCVRAINTFVSTVKAAEGDAPLNTIQMFSTAVP